MHADDADPTSATPGGLPGDNTVASEVIGRVRSALSGTHPDVTVRVSKSQVAFRRRRGFAFVWAPGQYIRRPAAPVVLSIASSQRLVSPRFKEVVHPGPWMHHLEITEADDVDDEVIAWLAAAADDAG